MRQKLPLAWSLLFSKNIKTGNFLHLGEGKAMQIDGSYEASNIFDLDAVDSKRKYSKIAETTTESGDTVDISDEAKKLYSEMIHKYDGGSSTTEENAEGEGGEEGGAGGAGGAGGSSGSSSGDSVESIKKKIESLKSQMSSLAAQSTGAGVDTAAMSKINALQAQIAALEAQLSEMEAAG